MPKMKTNRMAYKKFRVGGKGKIKRGHACTSHNTGKKSAKRMRHLRGLVVMDATNTGHAKRQLPHSAKGH